jgi:glucosamine-6-phosphate deaminase
MQLIVCEDYEAMSLKAAQLVAEGILSGGEPSAGVPVRENLISFPGGDTPLGMIGKFVEMVNGGKINISRTRYVSLDEWVGLGVEDTGSCAWFNHTHLLGKLETPFPQTHIINGKAADIDAERRELDSFIEQYGPLDVSVLGIGLNGHLGFNEENTGFDSNAHVIPLSETTKKVMYKYFAVPLAPGSFAPEYRPEYGITQGIKQIMAARQVILIVNGVHKAEILSKSFRGTVNNTVPASILQKHPNCFVVIDREAATRL